jgi:predicted GIY-YIG superfamily endonuclease
MLPALAKESDEERCAAERGGTGRSATSSTTQVGRNGVPGIPALYTVVPGLLSAELWRKRGFGRVDADVAGFAAQFSGRREVARGWMAGFNGDMPEQQLHLFEAGRPLLERFGAAFFKSVPARPGVYIMSGEGERVLYIGQSGNLRQRLGSYKNARPDRAPRKVIRLVHCVRSLVWEECGSVEAARLREAQLLRVHRPRFNVQSTYPRAYRFISVRRTAEGLEFGIGTEPRADWKAYGAFKMGCVYAYGALLRLLWVVLNRPSTVHELPGRLVQERPPREFGLRVDLAEAGLEVERLVGGVEKLLAGESDELVGRLTGLVPGGPEVSVFQRNFQAADLEILAGFYEYGAKRNRELRREHGLPGAIIPQETLDDLLALRVQTRRTNKQEAQGSAFGATLGFEP